MNAAEVVISTLVAAEVLIAVPSTMFLSAEDTPSSGKNLSVPAVNVPLVGAFDRGS